MYSVSFAKHTLECRVIVLGVLGKPLLGERQGGQELCVRLNVSLCDKLLKVRDLFLVLLNATQLPLVFRRELTELLPKFDPQISIDTLGIDAFPFSSPWPILILLTCTLLGAI